jgi:hypothetical protein
MNAITPAVIATLNVNIRFRPLVHPSVVAKRRWEVQIVEPNFGGQTFYDFAGSPKVNLSVSLALEPPNFEPNCGGENRIED